MTWQDMRLTRPADDAFPGTILNLPGGRVLVRSYDTTNAADSIVTGDNGDYLFDDSSIPALARNSAPKLGDTVFYVGEVRGDDSINLWCPMRVVWVGAQMDRLIRVRTLCDTGLADIYIGEQSVPLHMLTEEQRAVVKELATSLEPARPYQARVLLEVFNCDWVLDRSKAHK